MLILQKLIQLELQYIILNITFQLILPLDEVHEDYNEPLLKENE